MATHSEDEFEEFDEFEDEYELEDEGELLEEDEEGEIDEEPIGGDLLGGEQQLVGPPSVLEEM